MLATSRATADSYLAAIIQSSDDAIIARDDERVITSWNPAAEAMFGFTERDAVGQPITIIVPDSHIGEERELFERVLRGEIVRHVETVRRTNSGQLVDVLITMSPIKNADDIVVGAATIARSLADRTNAEAVAMRLAAIVHSSDDAIVSKDLNGIVMSWNPAAERMFGFPAEEMIGRSITTIIPADRLSEEDHVLSRVRAGIGVDHFETIRQRKNGSLIDVSLTVSPVKNAAGRIIGASKIARDITERRRLEEIRHRESEREEKARQDELEAENRRMHDAMRLKSEFIANMSHEFRTPLNAIIGFAELMHRGKVGELAPQHREYLGDILTSAQHLAQLINDVLDVAKIESGRIDFTPSEVDVAAVVREVRDTVRGLAVERHLDVSTDVDPGIGTVVLDAGKLKQVLYNYVSNAIKFTDEGGQVVIRALGEGDGHFRVEVEDTGIGIDPQDVGRLFIEFQQLDSSRTKQYPGTGLGLALTRRIVEAQGGRVWVRSAPGQGSTFYALLPKMVPALSADAVRPLGEPIE